MDETGNSCIEKYYKTRFNCMQEDIFIIFMNEKNFIIFIIKYIIYIWKTYLYCAIIPKIKYIFIYKLYLNYFL